MGPLCAYLILITHTIADHIPLVGSGRTCTNPFCRWGSLVYPKRSQRTEGLDIRPNSRRNARLRLGIALHVPRIWHLVTSSHDATLPTPSANLLHASQRPMPVHHCQFQRACSLRPTCSSGRIIDMPTQLEICRRVVCLNPVSFLSELIWPGRWTKMSHELVVGPSVVDLEVCF